MNWDTPNQVYHENQSQDLIGFRYSIGDVVLNPGQSQYVTVLLRNENFNILDRRQNILGGVSVQADSLMYCRPDYICITSTGQVRTHRPVPGVPSTEDAPLINSSFKQ